MAAYSFSCAFACNTCDLFGCGGVESFDSALVVYAGPIRTHRAPKIRRFVMSINLSIGFLDSCTIGLYFGGLDAKIRVHSASMLGA